MFFCTLFDNDQKSAYLCNVFFIVLDLRLTKVRVAAATHFFLFILQQATNRMNEKHISAFDIIAR